MFLEPVVSVDVPDGQGEQLTSSGISLYVPTGQSLQPGFMGSDVESR